jgi:hypothetical protein
MRSGLQAAAHGVDVCDMPDDGSGWPERNDLERPPPERWRAIGAYFTVSAVGVGALLLGPGSGRSAWEAPAGLVVLLALIQVLRGISRTAWLAMAGADRPLRTYLRKRFGG